MRYRVRHGCQAVRAGQVIARGGEVVELDLDLEADRRWLDAVGDILTPIPQPQGWVERGADDTYLDRSMRSRRRSER